MKLSNKQYDTLKIIALIIAPVIVFIGSICSIWGVPHCEEITATLAALDTLVGAIVEIARRKFAKQTDDEEDE